MSTTHITPTHYIVGRGVKLEWLPRIEVNLRLTLPVGTTRVDVRGQLMQLCRDIEPQLPFSFGHRETSEQADGSFLTSLFAFTPDEAKTLAQLLATTVATEFGPRTTQVAVIAAKETIHEIAA